MKRLKLVVFLLFLSWGSLAENDYEAVTKDDALTRLAFGSCADEEKDQPIWKSIEEFRPSMFLFLGDNVYGDKVNGRIVPKEKLLDSLKSAYLTAQTSQPEFIKFRSQTPYMATWDDHDYGRNDAGEDLFFKEEAKELFLNYWQVPDHDPRRSRPGVFYSKVFGPIGKRIQIIMLDTRFFRSKLIIKGSGVGGNGPYGPNRDESATLLGHEQWQWLEKKLEEHAEIRIIVSSIQIIIDK